MSALRSTLDAGSAAVLWPVDVEDVPGRAIMLPVDATLSIPARLEHPVRLSARVMLVPRDWRDGESMIRAWIAAVLPDATRTELWSGSLRSAAEHGEPDGLQVDCELPASIRTLLLGCDRPPPRTGTAVGRVIWIDPEIIDPAAPTPQAAPAPPAAPTVARAQPDGPLVSVLTPVHDPPIEMLEDAIRSVRAQTFGDWELCLVDDGSTDPRVLETLRQHAAEDARIQVTRRDQAGGIATATNAALELASGEYIALLDHDDALEPHALELVAQRILADPELDMIYSDEDILADGRRIAKHPKPDWSPEMFCTAMYTCHLGVYRRALATRIGGFNAEFDGCQDYDFVLRLTELTNRVAHIPQILYHWRAHVRSSASGEQAKPYAYVAQQRAISAHLERIGVGADVQFGRFPGFHRVVHRVDPSLTASVLLTVTGEDSSSVAVIEAARSLHSQAHPSWEIVLATPPATLETAATSLRGAGVEDSRIITVASDPTTDPTTALAAAARAARTDHLVFMQTPAIALTHDWLRRLIGYSTQPEIAAAGPIVLAPDGRISNAGVAITGGIPLFLLHGVDGAGGIPVVTNVSAVSGVLATRRDTFQNLGGLRAEMGDLALIDYCLRARQAQMRVVSVPDARLQSIGPDNPANDLPATWRLRDAWGQMFARDPYYNPSYRQDRGDYVTDRDT